MITKVCKATGSNTFGKYLYTNRFTFTLTIYGNMRILRHQFEILSAMFRSTSHLQCNANLKTKKLLKSGHVSVCIVHTSTGGLTNSKHSYKVCNKLLYDSMATNEWYISVARVLVDQGVPGSIPSNCWLFAFSIKSSQLWSGHCPDY